jgi:muconate cycloisomerase
LKLLWLDPSGVPFAGGSILVMVEDGPGLSGLGEVAPENGPARGDAIGLLRACAVRLETADARNINVTLDAVAEITGRDPASGPAVLGAIDSALHDLNGRRRGLPVHAILGGARRSEIGLVRRIDIAQAEQGDLGSAPSLRLVRRPGQQPAPAGRILAALDRIPPEIQVDIDADGAFDNPALARTFVEGILGARARLNVGLLQPLSDVDLVGHAVLRSSLPLPVILDASLRSSRHMAQIVRLGSADRVVANIDRLGGLREAIRAASIAEAAAIGVSGAGFARTVIGATAVLHLAAVLHDTFPATLERFTGVPDGAPAGDVPIDRGVARLGSAPGLGITLAAGIAGAFRTLD